MVDTNSTTQPSAYSRVVIATITAPLSVIVAIPIAALANALWQHHTLNAEDLGAMFGFSGLVAMFGYAMLLFFGLPIFLILRRLKMDSLWAAILVGYVTAVCVPLLLQLNLAVSLIHQGIRPAIAYSNLQVVLTHPSMLLLDPLFLIGPLIAGVFWLIAAKRSPP